MNEFLSVLQLYKKDSAKNCAAEDNGEVYESKEFLDEYEWTLVSQLDAALRHVGPFIATMEASEKVTCSLVIPMTLAIIHATSKDVPILCHSWFRKITPMLDSLSHSNLHFIGDHYAYYNCNFISLYSNGIEFIDIVK